MRYRSTSQPAAKLADIWPKAEFGRQERSPTTAPGVKPRGSALGYTVSWHTITKMRLATADVGMAAQSGVAIANPPTERPL